MTREMKPTERVKRAANVHLQCNYDIEYRCIYCTKYVIHKLDLQQYSKQMPVNDYPASACYGMINVNFTHTQELNIYLTPNDSTIGCSRSHHLNYFSRITSSSSNASSNNI